MHHASAFAKATADKPSTRHQAPCTAAQPQKHRGEAAEAPRRSRRSTKHQTKHHAPRRSRKSTKQPDGDSPLYFPFLLLPSLPLVKWIVIFFTAPCDDGSPSRPGLSGSGRRAPRSDYTNSAAARGGDIATRTQGRRAANAETMALGLARQ